MLAQGKVARSDFAEFVYYLRPVGWNQDLVMLQAYLDESGIDERARYFVLAGFIGKARQWVRLERLWTKHLADFGVTDFHATDLFGRREAFRGWDEDRVVSLCRKLVAAINPHGLIPLGSVTPLDLFFRREEWQRRILTGGVAKATDRWTHSGKPSAPYFMAFYHAVIRAVALARARGGDTKVHFFFDRQAQYEGLAQEGYREFLKADPHEDARRLGVLAYSSRETTPLLGLADLFAHLLYLHAEGRLAGAHPVQRWVFSQLLRRERQNPIAHFDDRSMNQVLKALGRSSRGLPLNLSEPSPTEPEPPSEQSPGGVLT